LRSSQTPVAPQARERRPITAGRNLPAAIAVGLGLGALVLITLFTVKSTFLIYVGLIELIALWELSQALGSRDIRMPLLPVAASVIATLTLAYWVGAGALVAALAVTVIVLMAWRLRGGAAGYVRDLTAGLLGLAYIPLMAASVALMLDRTGGARQALTWVILAISSDIGGYAAGVLLGRHLMAESISPKKTWEGLAGSCAGCLIAGALLMHYLLPGQVWQGLLLGLAAFAAAVLGDLAESMIKRDLKIKDMGTLLPGHGGILDRIDSLLIVAPVTWLLLGVFLPS
jgi:phosphatidate cytidylyltransferase